MFLTARDVAGFGAMTPAEAQARAPRFLSVPPPMLVSPGFPVSEPVKAQPQTVVTSTGKPFKEPARGYKWVNIKRIPSMTKQPDSYVWAVVPATISDEAARKQYAYLAERRPAPFFAPSGPMVTAPRVKPSKAKYLIPAGVAAAVAAYFLL